MTERDAGGPARAATPVWPPLCGSVSRRRGGARDLLHHDVTFSMPPYVLWLRGPEAVRAWLLGRGRGCRGSRLVPVAANGSPAFAQYREGGRRPWALAVLELEDDRIVGWTSFLDTDTLFPRFGLPPTLPPKEQA
jgi:RNA polymerase sigma-70 factor (ECF subfamily)